MALQEVWYSFKNLQHYVFRDSFPGFLLRRLDAMQNFFLILLHSLLNHFLFMVPLLLENLLYDSDILALLTNISIKALLASSVPFSDFSDSVFKKFDIIKLVLSDFKADLNSTLD